MHRVSLGDYIPSRRSVITILHEKEHVITQDHSARQQLPGALQAIQETTLRPSERSRDAFLEKARFTCRTMAEMLTNRLFLGEREKAALSISLPLLCGPCMTTPGTPDQHPLSQLWLLPCHAVVGSTQDPEGTGVTGLNWTANLPTASGGSNGEP